MTIVRVGALESSLSAALPTEYTPAAARSPFPAQLGTSSALGNRLGTTWSSEVREGTDVNGYMRMIFRLC